MPTSTEITEASVIGQLGLIIGDHPWTGCTGEIVRIEKTILGFGMMFRTVKRRVRAAEALEADS